MNTDKVLRWTLLGIVGTLVLFGLLLWKKIWAETVYTTYGTFYGGVVGPVATAMGFYFLYRAYQNQKSEADFALLNKLYADLLEDIASIHYRDKGNGLARLLGKETVYQGIDALYNFNLNDAANSVLNHLNLIIRSFEYLAERVEKSTYKDEEIKSILQNKIYLLYYAKIIWPVLQGVYKYKAALFTKGWANPGQLFFGFEKFTKQTVQYLVAQGLIEHPRLRRPQPDYLLLHILATAYELPEEWVALEYYKAQAAYKPRKTWRSKVGAGLGWVLPAKMVDFIKVNTRYPLLGTSQSVD